MNTRTQHLSRFEAFNISLDLVRCVRPVITAVKTHDADLARQLRKAVASVPLNLNEGRRRSGRDRLHSWRIAAGSADEAQACLLVAEAWGYIGNDDIERALELIDSLLAILWTLTNKPRNRRG